MCVMATTYKYQASSRHLICSNILNLVKQVVSLTCNSHFGGLPSGSWPLASLGLGILQTLEHHDSLNLGYPGLDSVTPVSFGGLLRALTELWWFKVRKLYPQNTWSFQRAEWETLAQNGWDSANQPTVAKGGLFCPVMGWIFSLPSISIPPQYFRMWLQLGSSKRKLS